MLLDAVSERNSQDFCPPVPQGGYRPPEPETTEEKKTSKVYNHKGPRTRLAYRLEVWYSLTGWQTRYRGHRFQQNSSGENGKSGVRGVELRKQAQYSPVKKMSKVYNHKEPGF